jgi:hypothetical protein
MTDTLNELPDPPTSRPDLTNRMLDLSPGQWWSPDGHLRMEIHRVGPGAAPGAGRTLPYGWVWVTGDLYQNGQPVDVCTVPVLAEALPPRDAARPLAAVGC